MSDAGGTNEVGRLAALHERRHATCAFDAMEGPVRREDLDARGIVSAVLERLKPLQKIA